MLFFRWLWIAQYLYVSVEPSSPQQVPQEIQMVVDKVTEVEF